MNIRTATIDDHDDIQRLHLCAFPEGENKNVSKLATDLLTEKATPQIISLIAEIKDTVAGHIAFSPVTINNHKDFRGYILAPLGVNPDYQKCGIGSQLIEEGIQKLSAMQVNMVFVYGDPKYYSKFGFSAKAPTQYKVPYKLEYPFGWQALVINKYDINTSPVTLSCVSSLSNPKLW